MSLKNGLWSVCTVYDWIICPRHPAFRAGDPHLAFRLWRDGRMRSRKRQAQSPTQKLSCPKRIDLLTFGPCCESKSCISRVVSPKIFAGAGFYPCVVAGFCPSTKAASPWCKLGKGLRVPGSACAYHVRGSSPLVDFAFFDLGGGGRLRGDSSAFGGRGQITNHLLIVLL